jgi:steroid 5-alpha reductase family enzyme
MYLRMNLTGLYLLKRKIPIDEFFGVTTAFAAYQIGFVLLGAWQPESLNILDVFGVLLFIIGSYFNTYSEIQRNRFKNDPNNKGKLYTQGLFKYAKHINYFGDVCWVTGWAIITHNLWAGIVPIMLTLGFIFFGIPELSSYLEKKYGDDYQEWSKDTKKLIPFIY